MALDAGIIARISLLIPPISVAAGCRNRPILTKTWPCPYGKVVPALQTPESNVFGIHCSGAHHKDRVRYGKVVPEFFQGSVPSYTYLLSMLIRVDKDIEFLGAVRLASTLAASAVAILGPTLLVRPGLGLHRCCIGDGP